MAKLTIGNKMLLSAGSLMAMSAVLALTAYLGITSIEQRLHAVLGLGLKKDIVAYRIQTGLSDFVSATRGELLHGFLHDYAAVEQYHRQSENTAVETQMQIGILDIMIVRPEAKQDNAQVRSGLLSAVDTEQEIYRAVASGNMPLAARLNTERLLPVALALRPVMADLLKVQDQVIATDGEQADASVQISRMICITGLIVCQVLGGVIFFVVRGMNRDLMDGVTELAGSIGEIASAASQVASSSHNMAQGASEQAATIQETSSASAEINSMAQRNTENSRTTAEIVSGAQVRTEQTNSSLTEMVQAMDGIASSSQKISKIIKVIDEIAFQTNILALNAAVEAARAGDAGMGFAVVADEVRNLAQRSAQAAKDTAGLIEESILRSNGGKKKVDQVAGGIHIVTEETARIKVLVDEINLGSVEQSRGIDQISRSITDMEQVTQSNAASAQESAAAAAELSAQAHAMRAVVERLSQMVGATESKGPVAGPVQRAAGSVARSRLVVPSRLGARGAASKAGSPQSAFFTAAGSSFPMDDDFKEF